MELLVRNDVWPDSISICMPAFNEENNIRNTVFDCIKILREMSCDKYEIIVVDDGSSDSTWFILEDLSRECKELIIHRHPCNLGIAEAQRWMIRRATGSIIYHMAADGEWKAKELIGLSEKLAEGYDVVIGVRGKKDYSLYRKTLSAMYNMLIAAMFGVYLRDAGSVKIARSHIWKTIEPLSSSSFYMTEKIIRACGNGASIAYVLVDHEWRKSGKSYFSNPYRLLSILGDMIRVRISLIFERK